MRPSRFPDLVALSIWMVPLVDMFVVGSSAILAAFVLTYLRGSPSIWPLSESYQVAVAFAIVVTPLVFFRLSLYRSHRGENPALELIQYLGGILVVFVVLGVIAIATKTSANFSRVWMLSWFLTSATLGWCYRIVLHLVVAHLRAHGRDCRNIVIIGSGAQAARVVNHLKGLRGAGYRLVGYLGEPDAEEPSLRSVRYLGSHDGLAVKLASLGQTPDQVWIALSFEQGALMRKVLDQLERTTFECRMVPDTLSYNLLNQRVSHVGGLAVIDLSSSPMAGINRLVKAVEDRLLAILILMLVSPLMVLIAIAIRLDSAGPILFRQKRHGWNGEEITVLKFRSMHVHVEPEGQLTQARKDDPRITRIGGFLRRTSLDELPQFFNVLSGSMSVVGPRPHPIELNHYYHELVSRYVLRHKVKPGITGWAQINDLRGETRDLEMMRQRIEYDLYYIEHWSIWFDLAIVALTAFRGMISRRAY